MSAFPDSGRSDHQKLHQSKDRFRPEAVARITGPGHEAALDIFLTYLVVLQS